MTISTRYTSTTGNQMKAAARAKAIRPMTNQGRRLLLVPPSTDMNLK